MKHVFVFWLLKWCVLFRNNQRSFCKILSSEVLLVCLLALVNKQTPRHDSHDPNELRGVGAALGEPWWADFILTVLWENVFH